MSPTSINIFSKKINRMPSKCQPTPIYTISHTKYAHPHTVSGLWMCECYHVSFTVFCSYNDSDAHWSQPQKHTLKWWYKTRTSEGSRWGDLPLMWTLDVQMSLLCLTHLRDAGCSLVLHLLQTRRDKKTQLRRQLSELKENRCTSDIWSGYISVFSEIYTLIYLPTSYLFISLV